MISIKKRLEVIEKILNINRYESEFVEVFQYGRESLKMTKEEYKQYLEDARARGCYVGPDNNGGIRLILPPELKGRI